MRAKSKRFFGTFSDTWKHKDESQNEAQNFDLEMITEAKKEEVEDEIRKKVDEDMREELDALKMVCNY